MKKKMEPSETLKNSVREIDSLGFPIYAFLLKFRKSMKNKKAIIFAPLYFIPNEILEPILDRFLKDFNTIHHKYGYLTKMLTIRIEQWWVDEQIRNDMQYKNLSQTDRNGAIESVKDILTRMAI